MRREREMKNEELLAAVRSRLAGEDEVSDERALALIAEELFADVSAEEQKLDVLREQLRSTFYRTRSRLGILKPLLDDAEITEIMVNGPETIFIEKNGIVSRSEIAFAGVQELEELMQDMAAAVHREINELNPIVDARLADGSRVSGVYKNIALNGPILTIRKFQDRYMSMSELIGNGTLSEEGALLLTALTRCGYNIFVSGGTSSGKTTLLNALSEAIPARERVIVIEDSAELVFSHIENLVRLECRQASAFGRGKISMSQLIRASLRMRPDRIIVGEVRGEEVLDMLQAMNTGHAGSMSTGHGNSVNGMLRRLEAMYMMAMPLDIHAIRTQIAEGIDIMVHVEKCGEKRLVTEICELAGYEEGNFVLNQLMNAGTDGQLTLTGRRLAVRNKLARGEEAELAGLQKLGIID